MTTRLMLNNILFNSSLAIFYISLLALFFLYFSILFNIQFGIDDIGVIGIYSDDEAAAIRLLMVNLKNNHLNPSGFYNYGYLYHTITFYMVKFLHYLDYSITEQLVAYVFRFISSISYLLSLIVLYVIGIKLQISKVLMILVVLLFASTPNLHFWAQTIHPDTLQVLFIEFAILIIILKNNVWTVMLAALVLGLAFAIKYSSVFLLPFLGLLSVYLFGIRNYKKWILYSAGLILVFVMTWLIVNPYVYDNFDVFLQDFMYESQHVKYGHGKAESKDGMLWFVALYKELGIFQSVVLIIGLSSFVVFLKKILQKYSKDLAYVIIILCLYVLVTFLYMYIEVNMRRIRYLFHMLPFVYLFSAIGYMHIIGYFKNKNYAFFLSLVILIVALHSTVLTIGKTTHMSKKGNHNYIKAYNFIVDRYPDDQFILADYYSYTGKYFKKYKSVWGVSDAHIKKFKPDIIIMNKLLSGRWYWKYSGTKFNDLKLYENKYDGHKQYYEFAKKIFSESSNYQVIYELEDIVILHKKN